MPEKLRHAPRKFNTERPVQLAKTHRDKTCLGEEYTVLDIEHQGKPIFILFGKIFMYSLDRL